MAGLTKAQRIEKEAKRILSENPDKTPYELFISGDLTDEQFKCLPEDKQASPPDPPKVVEPPKVDDKPKMRPILVEQKPIISTKPVLLGQPSFGEPAQVNIRVKATGLIKPVSAATARRLISKQPQLYERV